MTAAAYSAVTADVAVITAAAVATDATMAAVVTTTAAECSKKRKGADHSASFLIPLISDQIFLLLFLFRFSTFRIF